MPPKPNNSYPALYQKATDSANRVFLFICIASFFIFVAFFNYRISWKESEDQLNYSDKRDYWYSNYFEITEKDTVYEITLHGKREMEFTGTIKSDAFFLERYFEKRNLPANSTSNDVNNDKRMFLDMDALGINLYIQDMPLMGGFVVFLLFLWFIFARNNEYELFKKVKEEYEKVEEGKPKNKHEFDEVLYEKLFRKARNSSIRQFDGVISFFLSIARGLFVFIWLLLFVSFLMDLDETYRKGPDFQRYLYASAEVKVGNQPIASLDKIPIFGRRCDYLIDKMKLHSEAKYIVHENVPLKEYLNIEVDEKEANAAMNKLYMMEFLSAVFLILISVQIALIHKILSEEDKIREKLIIERDKASNSKVS